MLRRSLLDSNKTIAAESRQIDRIPGETGGISDKETGVAAVAIEHGQTPAAFALECLSGKIRNNK
jgi:hypothetical protein